jgi:hypothetical protein
MTGNELRATCATRDHVLTDCSVPHVWCATRIFAMLYLKNTLGGLSRSLTDSALSSFQGPHRWWKLALFAVLFVLPGGSVGVAVFAWFEHRRGRQAGLPVVERGTAAVDATGVVIAGASPAGACQAKGDARSACRAAAGKRARHTSVE